MRHGEHIVYIQHQSIAYVALQDSHLHIYSQKDFIAIYRLALLSLSFMCFAANSTAAV